MSGSTTIRDILDDVRAKAGALEGAGWWCEGDVTSKVARFRYAANT